MCETQSRGTPTWCGGVIAPGDRAGKGWAEGWAEGWAASAAGAGGWLSQHPPAHGHRAAMQGDGIEEDAGCCKAGMQWQAM